MEQVPARPALHLRKAGHEPPAAPVLALHHVQQYLGDGEEEHGHEQRHYLRQDDQREGEPELLLREGVAHVNDVQDDEQDDEDEAVEHHQEGAEGRARQVRPDAELLEELRQALQALPAVPCVYHHRVERKRQDLQVVQPGLQRKPHQRLLVLVLRLLVEDDKEHVEDGILEVRPRLQDGISLLQPYLRVDLGLLHAEFKVLL